MAYFKKSRRFRRKRRFKRRPSFKQYLIARGGIRY